MDREKFSIRRKSIKSVDEDLLESEILFLTGRCDRYGHQIAIFPNKANDLLSTKYSPADVIVLIRYYYSLCYHGKHTRGLAFVVNLHQWKKTGIQVLVDALDMAQDYHRGTVGALYAIQPRTKYLQKHFKKLTGLRTSKCNPKVPCYETVCVSVPSELLSFMDVRQLTADFGGALKYNHRAWITFMKTIDDLEENVNRALDKLPEAHDKMAILAQCQIPDTKPEIAAVLSNVYKKSKAIMRDLNLEQLIDECKEVIKALTDPSIEPNYAEIKDTATFTEAKNNIEQYLKQLVSSRNDLRQAWNDAEVRILHTVKMKKCMNTAEELMSWINDIGIPAVKEPAEIADCLSNAEILKTEYETGFLNIAKKVLSQSEYIQHMLEDNCKKQTTSNVQLLFRRFCEAVEHFRKLVLSKHRVYLNVYDFYLTAHKTMKWYHQTVNFIPLHLLFCEQECVFSSHYILHGTAAWHAAVSDYQLYHPPPKTDHLTKLISILPVLDTRIKLQVRLLIHRVKVLRMLLENCSKVDIEDLESVWKWKRQVKSGSDDITLDLDTKVLDLLSVGQMPSETQEQHRPGSASGIKIAPKLKSASDREVRGATPETKVGRCDVRWQSANIRASPRTSSDDESQISDQVFEADRKLSPGSERYVSLGYVNNSGYESNLKHFNSKRIWDHQSCSGLSNDSGLLTSLSNPHLEKCSHSEHNQTQDVSGYSWNMPVLNHAPLDRVVTVNDVYNSNLDAEEKLDIMAKICSGNFKVNEEIYYKLKPDPQAMSSAKPHRSNLHISDAERSAFSKSRVQGVSKPESVLTNVNAETSKVGDISETLSKRAVRRIPARRRLYKKSSIKVEEWMQKLEHQVEMSWPRKVQKSGVTHGGHSSPRNEEAATSHDVATASPQQVRNEDPEVTECSLIDSDTEDLDAIDKQLTELSLEEVNFEQNVLEASLQEVGRILKEQEEFLLKECEPVLPTSPVSMLSSSTSHKSETELAADESKQRCPLVDVPHISTPVDGDGMDAQHEGSLSEESGVYTQSTDSRPRLSTYPSYPGSNFGLNYIQPAHSTLHPSRPERLQVMNEASLGDSSSQTTVMTEICRKPSTRQNSSEAANEQLASTSKANIEDTQDDSVDLDMANSADQIKRKKARTAKDPQLKKMIFKRNEVRLVKTDLL